MTTIENTTESFRAREEFPEGNNLAENAVNTIATETFKKRSENAENIEFNAQPAVKGPLKPHGELWECVEILPQEVGNILKFKLRRQFDSFTYPKKAEAKDKAAEDIYWEIFPAVEPTIKEMPRLTELDPMSTEEMDLILEIENSSFTAEEKKKNKAYIRSQYRVPKLLQKLGYKSSFKDGVYLYLPDKECLKARFEKLREIYPALGPLSIVTSEEIASDLEFIEAYSLYDILLSTGKEFVHDHLFHAIGVLGLMFSYLEIDKEYPRAKHQSYAEVKAKMIEQISIPYNKIKAAKKALEKERPGMTKSQVDSLKSRIPVLEAALGAAVDQVWAAHTPTAMDDILKGNAVENKFIDLWTSDIYKKYHRKRFGDEPMDFKSVVTLWAQIKELAKTQKPVPKH